MMVAHELKNPIAIIKGSVDVFRKKGLDEETRRSMIVYIDDEIQRLNRLVDEFLLFAKPKEPNFSMVSMKDFITHVVEKYAIADNAGTQNSGSTATGSDGGIKHESVRLLLEGDVETLCDVFLLERAVMNILKNAVENSGPGAVDIEVCAKLKGLSYVMEIKDRGRGIDEAVIDDIFNPFFTTRAKGTGLGLAIVRDIVSVHGGNIRAWNREGGGACFEIQLPVNTPLPGNHGGGMPLFKPSFLKSGRQV